MTVLEFRRIELARGRRALAHELVGGGALGRALDVVAIAFSGAARRGFGAVQPPQSRRRA